MSTDLNPSFTSIPGQQIPHEQTSDYDLASCKAFLYLLEGLQETRRPEGLIAMPIPESSPESETPPESGTDSAGNAGNNPLQ